MFKLHIIVCVQAILGISSLILYLYFSKKRLLWLSTPMRRNNSGNETNEIDADELNEVIEIAGFCYDPLKDIFYSNMYPWQRKYGYCQLYDDAAAPFGMIVDCEPITFDYNEKKWLIEFWKGQYDLTTGGEIGVYTTENPEIDIPEVFLGNFYQCAEDKDRLDMSFVLKKKGKVVFTRSDKHWWLTGFKLGEFSQPSELTMKIRIVLKDKPMCNAFVKALKEAGYLDREIDVNGNTVRLEFNNPRTPQPITRTAETDFLIQKKNKLLCDKYIEITGPYDNFLDKINALRQQEPELFDVVINIGKSNLLFEKYKEIKDYID